MIDIQNLSKIYTSHGRSVKALDNINLHIAKGECICLKGPSGSGKTTLLNIIGGMLVSTCGTIRVKGQTLSSLPQHFLSSYRRKHVGMIFQQFNLLPDFTVLENLLLPLVPWGRPLNGNRERIEALVDSFQLSHRIHFDINALSGGEQQRVAVVRALVNDPDIIIADEPFSNLDPKNAEIILDKFMNLKAMGKTFVLASHSLAFELGRFVDREFYIDAAQ